MHQDGLKPHPVPALTPLKKQFTDAVFKGSNPQAIVGCIGAMATLTITSSNRMVPELASKPTIILNVVSKCRRTA